MNEFCSGQKSPLLASIWVRVALPLVVLTVLLGGSFRLSAQSIAPSITQQPVGEIAIAGDTASISVTATGTALSYQWLLDGKPNSGATNSTITLTNVSLADSGAYTVRVSNSAGSVESQFARLIVVNSIRLDSQPVLLSADESQSVAFSVEKTEPPAVASYEWRFGNQPIAGQTNSVLLLTNLTPAAAGDYTAVITRSDGIVTRGTGVLVVRPYPSDRTFRLALLRGGARVQIPITFFSRGDESQIDFSMSFDGGVLTNGTFAPGTLQFASTNGIVFKNSSSAVEDRSKLSAGLYGVSIISPTNTTFAGGFQTLGAFQFDVAPGADPNKARLSFTNQPVDFKVSDTNGASLTFLLEVPAQWNFTGPTEPTLNRQSGLFEQQIDVSNPGATDLVYLRLQVRGLGFDSLTNQIRLYNSVGLTNSTPYVEFGPLASGATQRLTLEYYATDRRAAFHPQFELEPSGTAPFLPPRGTTFSITSSRFVNGTFLIEFPTSVTRKYFVQYVSSANDFNNASAVKTAQPALVGTGSQIQWIDNGPPKTESRAAEGSRFYRILESN